MHPMDDQGHRIHPVEVVLTEEQKRSIEKALDKARIASVLRKCNELRAEMTAMPWGCLFTEMSEGKPTEWAELYNVLTRLVG
jgi:hypothetical protein